MGRGVSPVIHLAPSAIIAVKYACVEVYPKEAFGWLVGYYEGNNVWNVEAAIPTQVIHYRSHAGLVTHDDSHQAFDSVLEDHAVGDFHSHPNGSSTMSETDREDMLEQEPDLCYIVASVYPSKQKAFAFQLAGYAVLDGRIRRAELR